MSYIEVFYNPSSCDWMEALDRQVERTLRELICRPDTIICLPLEPGGQLELFKTDGAKTDGYHTNSLELSGE